jgi:hypothetical protein
MQINLRLLTWEIPEWRQAGRRYFTHDGATAIVSSPSNIL